MKRIMRIQFFFLIPIVCAFVLFLPGMTLQAHAYDSWIQNTDAYKDFYEKSDLTPDTKELKESGDEGFLLNTLGSALHYIAKQLSTAFIDSKANLTIDGIVFGKMAQPIDPASGQQICYTRFDLSQGNVYGIAGATIYTVFRGFTYSGFFLMFLYLLAKAMLKLTPKAMEDLKNGIYQIIIGMILIYLLPHITDICIFLVDQFVYMAAKGLGAGGRGLLETMENMYESATTGKFIRGVVFAATVFANLIYLKDYVSVAIQQTLLFGFFCIFNLLGVERKKYLTDWAALFFSNMLYPVLDVVTLLLPFMAINALSSSSGSMSLMAAIVVIIMIWSARTCRSQLLKLFGNISGTPAGRGLGGLAQMAQMARMAAAMRRGGGGNAGAESGEGYSDWKNEEQRQSEISQEMTRQASEISKGLPDISAEMESAEAQSDVSAENELQEFLGENGGSEEDSSSSMVDAQDWDVDDAGVPDDMGQPELNAALDDSAEEISDLPPMSDFDRQRFDNLEEMDKLDTGINDLRDENAEIDRQIAAARSNDQQALHAENAEIDSKLQEMENTKNAADAADSVQMASLDKVADADKIAEIQGNMSTRQAQYDTDTGALKQQRAENNRTMHQAKSDQDAKIAQLQAQKVSNEQQIVEKQRDLDVRRNAEKQFVQVARDHGKSASQYSNSKEMRLAMETKASRQATALEAAKRKAAVSLDDLKGFSPEAAAQIAKYQKDAIRAANTRRAIGHAASRTATAAATVVGAVTAGAALAYGGEEATMQGIMLGGMAAGGLVKGTGGVAKTLYNHREEIGDSVMAKAGTVADMARQAHERDRRLFSRSGIQRMNSTRTSSSNENLRKTEEYAYQEHGRRPSMAAENLQRTEEYAYQEYQNRPKQEG